MKLLGKLMGKLLEKLLMELLGGEASCWEVNCWGSC